MARGTRLFTTNLVAILLTLLSAFISGCARGPAGGSPIYLQVDSAKVVSDANVYGSASSRIPDVWIETGPSDLGAYEMPIRIPVLAEGDVRMIFSAGIYENGIISARQLYPFYMPDTFTIHNAVAGQVYIREPIYQYFPNTKFALKADFNTAVGFSHMSSAGGGVEGNCGAITMSAQDTVTSEPSVQSNAVNISTNGRQAYLEMNYRMSDSASMYCQVGISATSGGVSRYYTLTVLKPTGYWRKVYLNFSDFVGNNSGSNFQVYFSVSKDAGQAATMYVDNVKLLYFD